MAFLQPGQDRQHARRGYHESTFFFGGLIIGVVAPFAILTVSGHTITDKDVIAEYDKMFYKRIYKTTLETDALGEGKPVGEPQEGDAFSTLYKIDPLVELKAEDVERVCITSAYLGYHEIDEVVLDIYLKDRDKIYKSLDAQGIFSTDTPTYSVFELGGKQIGGFRKIVPHKAPDEDSPTMSLSITELDLTDLLPLLTQINPAKEIATCGESTNISDAVLARYKLWMSKEPVTEQEPKPN